MDVRQLPAGPITTARVWITGETAESVVPSSLSCTASAVVRRLNVPAPWLTPPCADEPGEITMRLVPRLLIDASICDWAPWPTATMTITAPTPITMLGIVIGVGAVIVMVAVGQGAQSQIEASISSLGTNLIVVSPGSSAQGGVSQGAGTFNRLSIADAEKLKIEGTTLAAVSPVIQTRMVVIGPAGNWRTSINGVSPDYFTIRDWVATSGETFTDADVKAARKIAVLGATVAKNLFPGVDAVGAQIQIGHVPFTVSGVLVAKGQNATGSDQDDVTLLPYTTAQNRLSGNVRIGQILVSTISANDIPAAQEEISSIMREAHRLEDNPDDFTVRNQTEIAKAATSTTSVMSGLLAAIASISLIVGGIGIMNIMLVSVTERTREIGIRMAIGARGSDVLTQFLVE